MTTANRSSHQALKRSNEQPSRLRGSEHHPGVQQNFRHNCENNFSIRKLFGNCPPQLEEFFLTCFIVFWGEVLAEQVFLKQNIEKGLILIS